MTACRILLIVKKSCVLAAFKFKNRFVTKETAKNMTESNSLFRIDYTLGV